MSVWNDIVTTGTAGVYSPDNGFSAPGVGMWTNTSYGQAGLGTMGTNSGEIKSMIPGIGDAMAQDQANAMNVQLSRENRNWMERMSNTAYQRAMDDMREAGLNPMLAYQQGGASVPSPSAPSVSAAPKTGLADAALGAFTGISAAKTAQQNANTAQAQADSTIGLQGAQTANTMAQVQKTEAETQKTLDSIKSQKVRRELERNQIKLSEVKESAASLAQKGLHSMERVSNAALKHVARPSVDSRTLQYNNPLIPDLLENWMNSRKGK